MLYAWRVVSMLFVNCRAHPLVTPKSCTDTCIIDLLLRPQKPCQTAHVADTKSATESLHLVLLPGQEPWTGHAIELLYLGMIAVLYIATHTVIAFAMIMSACHTMWFCVFCNSSRGNCNISLGAQSLSTLQSLFGNLSILSSDCPSTALDQSSWWTIEAARF